MKKIMFVLAMFALGTLSWAASAREDATDRLDNATTVLHEIMGMPDKGIPEEVLEHAKCVAVIPHMVKGGFVFGAEGGKGVATCRTADGWSAPAFITISGGSWGLQIGVEAVDVVMIFQNDKAMQRLLDSNFQVGGDASAAAGWTPCRGRYGLEVGYRNPDLLPCQGRVRRTYADRRIASSRQRFTACNLWTQRNNAVFAVGPGAGSGGCSAVPCRDSRSKS